VDVSDRGYAVAQGLIGCMIAKMLPTSISANVSSHWLLFIVGVLSVVGASFFLGWVMTRLRVLPGSTLVWGLSPGAATSMTLMAESYGADMQLVAFMQYLRVVLVAATASVVARCLGLGAAHATHTVVWFSAFAWTPLAETLALAILGPMLARRMKIRAGGLLVPLIGGVLLIHAGLMTIVLPRWLMAMAYAFIGWRIGLRFTRPLLLSAAKAFPRILVCTMALIALCAGLGGLLVVIAGVDPLTAYLATSPGGADTMAIIAASSNVDTSVVMTMQMLRFLAVLILGPAVATFVAERTNPLPPNPDNSPIPPT
jgi:membrane AbrB-like protein